MQDLHQDHLEVSSTIDKLAKIDDGSERNRLFKEMMDMLLAHSQAEHDVIRKYRSLKTRRPAASPLRAQSTRTRRTPAATDVKGAAIRLVNSGRLS